MKLHGNWIEQPQRRVHLRLLRRVWSKGKLVRELAHALTPGHLILNCSAQCMHMSHDKVSGWSKSSRTEIFWREGCYAVVCVAVKVRVCSQIRVYSQVGQTTYHYEYHRDVRGNNAGVSQPLCVFTSTMLYIHTDSFGYVTVFISTDTLSILWVCTTSYHSGTRIEP